MCQVDTAGLHTLSLFTLQTHYTRKLFPGQVVCPLSRPSMSPLAMCLEGFEHIRQKTASLAVQRAVQIIET